MNRGTKKIPAHAIYLSGEPCETSVTDAKKNYYTDRFSKPARLIEKVIAEPSAVINKAFSDQMLNDLIEDQLRNWLRVALINTESPYSKSNSRKILYDFFGQLLLFIEALYIISDNSVEHPSLLNEEQIAKPTLVIAAFFQQFSIDYVRRELCDFLEAGIGYEGNYPNGFTPWQAWMTYNHVLCLTEAAYLQYVNGLFQPVNNIDPPKKPKPRRIEGLFSLTPGKRTVRCGDRLF